MSESPYEGTFRERIAVNRRNSLLLIAAFLAFVAVFGYVIGWAWIGDPVGHLRPRPRLRRWHRLRPRHLLRRRQDGTRRLARQGDHPRRRPRPLQCRRGDGYSRWSPHAQ